MAAGTKIGWTHRPGTVPTTLSPVLGCHMRSAGCGLPRQVDLNAGLGLSGGCFAIREVVRQQHLPGRDGLVHRDSDGRLNWTGKVVLMPERLREPYGWTTERTAFINDLSELFDDDVPDAYIAALWCVFHWTSRTGRDRRLSTRRNRPTHTYMVLGKNHARMRTWINNLWGDRANRVGMIQEAVQRGWCDEDDLFAAPDMPAVLENVWVGVSTEDQEWAAIRLHSLARTNAAVRYASAEPLLGPLDLTNLPLGRGRFMDAFAGDLKNAAGGVYAAGPSALDWVIAGGESKPGSRPSHPNWFRAIRDQCVAAGTPFFFKQWGDWAPQTSPSWPPGDWVSRPDRHLFVGPDGSYKPVGNVTGTEPAGGYFMHRVGKKAAGELLDGREWKQFPA